MEIINWAFLSPTYHFHFSSACQFTGNSNPLRNPFQPLSQRVRSELLLLLPILKGPIFFSTLGQFIPPTQHLPEISHIFPLFFNTFKSIPIQFKKKSLQITQLIFFFKQKTVLESYDIGQIL